MPSRDVKRKLTAILSADVKGYSRLMGEDEKWTVRTLNVYKEIMANLIQEHRGRVVDAPGDNVLAEFGSVVDAAGVFPYPTDNVEWGFDFSFGLLQR